MAQLENGVWLLTPDGEPHQVPDNPGVVKYFISRGYEITELPAELDSDDPEFVEALEKLQAEKSAAAKSASKSKKEVDNG